MAGIIEHADWFSEGTCCGTVYSWTCSTDRDAQQHNLARAGWREKDGRLQTTDPDLVLETADVLRLDIVTDGSHAALKVPGILCEV